MSDWAAKLSRTPKPPAIHIPGSSGPSTVGEPKRSGERSEKSERSERSEKSEKSETPTPNDGNHETPPAENGEKAAKQKKNPDSNGFKDDPRETYNNAEVLSFLHGRFERDMADARRDKGHENTMVYRSLESASAWNTSSGGGKKGSDEDGFNLLRELNRTTMKSRRP